MWEIKVLKCINSTPVCEKNQDAGFLITEKNMVNANNPDKTSQEKERTPLELWH